MAWLEKSLSVPCSFTRLYRHLEMNKQPRIFRAVTPWQLPKSIFFLECLLESSRTRTLCRSTSERSFCLGISLGIPEASKQLTEQAGTTSHGGNIRNATSITKVVEITLLKRMFLLQMTKFGFFFSSVLSVLHKSDQSNKNRGKDNHHPHLVFLTYRKVFIVSAFLTT